MFVSKTWSFSLALCVSVITYPPHSMAQNVTGSGTAGKVPVWTDATTEGDSAITQNGTSIGIGTATPNATLHVCQSGRQWSSFNFGTNLLVEGTGRHPTIGLLDAYGNNPLAITNSFGELLISKMPLLGDISSGPVRRFIIDSNGYVGIGQFINPKGGLHIANNAEGWSSFNFGTNLLISPGGPVPRHPTLGLFDANGGNPWAITNGFGELQVSQMPALGNTTSGPVKRFSIDSSGNISVGSKKVIDNTGRWIGDPTGLVGPQGPQGIQGPPGPPVSTSAICYTQGSDCSLVCTGKVIARIGAPCYVTSDTGTCTNNLSVGWCCVCSP